MLCAAVAARKALRFSDDRETLVNQVTSLHRVSRSSHHAMDAPSWAACLSNQPVDTPLCSQNSFLCLQRQLAQSELQCRKPVAACALCYTDVEDLREENSALRVSQPRCST